MKSALLLLLAAPLLIVLLSGCDSVDRGRGQGNTAKTQTSDSGAASSDAATTILSSAGGTPVGATFAEAVLGHSGGLGVDGTALFKGVGSLGVQVDLSVSGLPTGDPGATYYAQVHEGSCPDKQPDEGGAGIGPALVRFGGLWVRAQEYAHGGEEHNIPEEQPGSIEQPVSFSSSADGSASVSTLLMGVQKEKLMSGGTRYVDLHSAESDDAPVLACGVLKKRR
jgi:hypothetical protein